MQASNEHTSKVTIELDRIRVALGPVLSMHGITLVDVEWFTDQGAWTLRLTIEREGNVDAGGGVSLDDCADVSRDASAVLDVEDIVPHHYNLEVSSPGLDRKLKRPEEFVRFRGKLARVKLARPAPDGQRLLRGVLAEAAEGMVAVIVDGKRIEAPFDDVVEARLVFELEPQPKKSERSGKVKRGKPKG
jgi:ribosome maturation factor RimP